MSDRQQHADAPAPLPPGPRGLPLLGSSLAAARDGFGLAESLRAYGDLASYRAFGRRFVVVMDPEVIETVLVSRNDEFCKGEFESELGDAIAPEGLAFAGGETWRGHRLRLQPAFRPDRIRRYGDAMAAYTADLVDGWDDGEVVSLQDAFSTLALRVLTRTLFDLDFDASRGAVVREAAAAIQDLVDATPVLSLLPGWVPTRTERRFDRRMAALDDLVSTLVAERRADPEGHDDLLTTMLDAGDDGGMDADAVRDQLVTFLFAGHETTSTALTYTTWLLAGHPGVRDRLDTELDAVLEGPGPDSLPGSRDPTFDDIADLDYTGAVVDEALRLYPPVYSVFRQPREAVRLGGYRIPADATLQLSAYHTHRDERFWDEPTAFRPARWLDEAPDRPEYAYFPFGGGPRHCIGMRFAMTELQLALATMARRVEFERVTEEVDPRLALLLDPGEVRVRVGKR